jgi:hypothetical protein
MAEDPTPLGVGFGIVAVFLRSQPDCQRPVRLVRMPELAPAMVH